MSDRDVSAARDKPVPGALGADESAAARLERASARTRSADIPLLEWLCAAIGLVLLVCTIGIIVWNGVRADGKPPQIEFRVTEIRSAGDAFLVSVRALNRGDHTAADVKVEGTLATSGGNVETSEMSFKYLPPRSERSGGMYFTRDPRRYTLTLTPKGYEAP